MIAACPKCQTRYRIRPEQVKEKGMRLRCRRCESIFRVRPPTPEPAQPAASAQSAPPMAAPESAAPPAPELSAPQSVSAPDAPVAAPTPPAPRAPVGSVIVVHEHPDEAKALCDSLEPLALAGTALSDGVEALLAIQRTLPSAAILAADLPRMNGHEMCELMKRNESLREIPLILLGGDGARGSYGADRVLDADPGEALARALLDLGVGELDPRASGSQETPIDANDDGATPADHSAPASDEAPPPPLPASENASGEAVERAERLARIAISDIVLYNEEKFEAALRSGNVIDGMRDEVEEGRALLRERIDPDVFAERDFIAEELLRVAERRNA